MSLLRAAISNWDAALTLEGVPEDSSLVKRGQFVKRPGRFEKDQESAIYQRSSAALEGELLTEPEAYASGVTP
jgi:hypothetical protein